MTFELNAAFSLIIGIGAAIGWVRYKRTDPAFLPFLLLVTIAFVNECISIVVMKTGYSNIFNYNIFELVESLLLTWQFLKWGLFKNRRPFSLLLQFLWVGLWLGENLVNSFHAFNSYFIIAHSFIIVMMSISMINRITVHETTSLLKHPVFLICTGLIIYFDYSVLVEAFWMFGLYRTKDFRLAVYEIIAYINLVTNLIFAFAFIWIPMKPQYIEQC